MRLETPPRVADVAPAVEPEREPTWLRGLAVGVVVAGILLRLWTRSRLWLDEALSVNIAEVPLGQLQEALRQDGAPPLYYLLLHGWIRLFGSGPVAVRSLSALFSVAALPVAWYAGRRIGGRKAAWLVLLLLAASPYAIRYGTEARMYSLVQLLVLLGYLALHRAFEDPRPARLVPLAVVTGLLPLTHYWAFYLLAAVFVLLVVLSRREPYRRPARRSIAAMAAGGVLFLPWLPTFVYQLAHTGTPWGRPAQPFNGVVTTFVDFGGGAYPPGKALGFVLLALIAFALFGRARDAWTIDLDLHTRPGVRAEAAVAFGTLAIALALSLLSGAAYASRYTSVLFPIVILAAAVGFRAFASRPLALGLLALMVLLGMRGGVGNLLYPRTQAHEVAATILAKAQPGDLVAYCPDQLGPGVSRLLPEHLEEVTFPRFESPELIDWSDYAERNRVNPNRFAEELVRRAGDRTIWLVWLPGYRTLGTRCERISGALKVLRPASEIALEPESEPFEKHYVTESPAR